MIAFIIRSWSVIIVFRCFPPMQVRNVVNNHSNIVVVSSARKAHPKRQLSACHVIPTIGANFILYLFVL